MSGHYCARCGAPRLEDRPLTVRRFAAELWNEITSVDSHTLRTFRALLTRPGQLTREFLDGRTRWYLPPLRLYLVAFGLMVFARSFTNVEQQLNTALKTQAAKRATDSTETRLQARAAKAGVAAPDFAGAVGASTLRSFSNPWLHLVDPMAVGALLVVMYRRRRRNYAEHVLFALHVLAFNCLLSIVSTGLHSLRGGLPSFFDGISVLHWLGLGTYFYFASRRVYGESAPRTTAKSVAFVAGGQAAMFIVPFSAAFVSAIWTALTFVYALKTHRHQMVLQEHADV